MIQLAIILLIGATVSLCLSMAHLWSRRAERQTLELVDDYEMHSVGNDLPAKLAEARENSKLNTRRPGRHNV